MEQISLDYKNAMNAYKQNLQAQRDLLDKLVNFQSLMCKEYLELKDRIEALEKEVKDKNEANLL